MTFTREFVSRHFPSAQAHGDRWQARCPGHEDRKVSLSITTGDDGRVLLHCHAGCTVADVVARLGVTTGDLFPPRDQSSSRRRTVAEYVYRLADGTPSFRVVRYTPKDFRQHAADGAGGWLPTKGTAADVVYRLHELQGESDIAIVEGESDADRCWALGLPATCNAGGASQNVAKPKWQRHHAEQLRDAGVRRAVLLPDNDPPGRAHMHAVAASLQAVGIAVHWCDLPNLPRKGDVSDALDAGLTKDALAQALQDAPVYDAQAHADAAQADAHEATQADCTEAAPPPRKLRVRCAADVQPLPLRALWPGYLYRGKLSLLAGMGEIGKTYAGVCDVAARGSCGRPMPDGSRIGMFRTLIVSAEDSADDTLVPRLQRLGADMRHIFIVDGADAAGFLLGRDLAVLDEAIVEYQVDVVFLDALNSFIGGRVDTSQDAAIRAVLGPVVAMAAARDVSVVGIAHFGKGDHGHVVNKILGSVGFGNLARVVIGFAPDVEQAGRAFMAVIKNNLAPKPEPLAYRIDAATGLVTWETAAGLDVVGAFNAKPTRHTGGTQAAVAWLRDMLTPLGSTGMPSIDVLARGAAAGYRRDVLFEAKKALGVRARKLGFTDRWVWYLDAEASAAPLRNSDASTLRGNIKDSTKSREESPSDASEGWPESSFEASEESSPRESDSSHEAEVAADVA